MCDGYCKDCFFHTNTDNTGPQGVCDYLLITLSRRPCTSGTGCVVKVKKRTRGKHSLDERRRMWCRGYFVPN